MVNDITLHKVHYLNRSMRFLMIGLGVLVWSIPLMPFMAHAANPGSIDDFILIFGIVIVLSVPCLFYAFRCHLVTTPEGIIDYTYYPFYSFKSWKDLERIDIGGSGIVFLIFAPKMGRKTNRTISISTYIDNWNESELVIEIKKYAPHLVIPEDYWNRKEVSFLYRTSTLLLYFVISMFFVLGPNALLPKSIAEQFGGLIGTIAVGGILAALGGMEGLIWFGEWQNAELNSANVNKMTILFYCVPFLGMGTAYAIYMLFQLIPFLPEELKTLSIMILCFAQLRITLRVFGNYLFSR